MFDVQCDYIVRSSVIVHVLFAVFCIPFLMCYLVSSVDLYVVLFDVLFTIVSYLGYINVRCVIW